MKSLLALFVLVLGFLSGCAPTVINPPTLWVGFSGTENNLILQDVQPNPF